MRARKGKRRAQLRESQDDDGKTPEPWDSFKLPTGQPQTHASSPSELFEECTAQEQRTKKSDIVNVLDKFARFYLFDRPLFGETSEWTNDGYPLLFTIPQPKTVSNSTTDWRYPELLRHLKKLDAPDLRWVLIARWLNEEGVCEPEKFLPASVFRRMLKKTRAEKIRLSCTEVYL